MSAPNLRLLDSGPEAERLRLASELFHQLNRLIPVDQDVLSVRPDDLVRDAVAQMALQGYSSVPVKDERGIVRGVFSLETFAKKAARGTLEDWKKDQCAPGDWTVAEVLEQFSFARLDSEMDGVFAALEENSGILVGSPEKLVGILTPIDFLKYLYEVASPYVMVSEIELALRALISKYLTRDELEAVANRVLTGTYGEGKVPTTLDRMSFDNYRTLICSPDAWSTWFKPVFGGTPQRMSGRLKQVGDIRNELFHFRRSGTIEDHLVLRDCRNLLLLTVEIEDAQGTAEASA